MAVRSGVFIAIALSLFSFPFYTSYYSVSIVDFK